MTQTVADLMKCTGSGHWCPEHGNAHRTTKENPAVKKSALKAARAAVREESNVGSLMKAALRGRQARIAECERYFKNAKTGQERATWSYELSKAKLAASHAAVTALGIAANQGNQGRAIADASAPAIRRAQGAALRTGGQDPKRALAAVLSGQYIRQSLPRDETQLSSQSRIQDLEDQLRKAANPQQREAIGYQLTRAKLVRGHRLGEI